MTTINPVASSSLPSRTKFAAATGLGNEFNSFIQLLTAQVKNQDPLSPLELDAVRRAAGDLFISGAAGPFQSHARKHRACHQPAADDGGIDLE